MSQIKLTADSGGGTTSLKAPASTTGNANVVLKLPIADGSANQVLKTDGSGQLSFGDDTGGKILQIVQATTTGTNNYASVDFQNTVVTANITPTKSTSKFLIETIVHFGIGSEDCSVSFNFSDSLHASGTTHPIAPMSTDGTNGASNSRLPAYFGHGSFAGTAVDDFFLGNVVGKFLYTPASNNANQRAFTVMVRSAEGINVRFNMNGQYNAGNPRDIRTTSTIIVSEVAA